LQAAERKIAVAGIVFDFIRHDVAAGLIAYSGKEKKPSLNLNLSETVPSIVC